MKTIMTALASLVCVGLTAQARAAEEPTIPSCSEPFGTMALREPKGQNNWWVQMDLESPDALIKYYVNESNCFTMVDRGDGLAMRETERGLADSGELQVDSNIGMGQMVAADFFLIPDLITDDDDSGGANIGGAIGGMVGGRVGGLLGGLKTKNIEADTILTLVNARTGVQQLTARGQAKKRDISFGGGGLFGGIAGLGGGYADTEVGRVVATAYATAYTELVAKLQASGGAEASAASATQAYRMAVDSEMYKGPARGEAVRGLRQGMTVFPTGNRDGAFMEVKDKFGTLGWVSVEDLE